MIEPEKSVIASVLFQPRKENTKYNVMKRAIVEIQSSSDSQEHAKHDLLEGTIKGNGSSIK